ncbi:uncharacterized protein LOC131670298 [Phymastichus coffea]|uniref:uncharacterized protein LOC131670298 n=1 Tax=Phymastichus coffea TaxID=108790 RepID=UPI00273BCE4C|nr:uncharacterized protein LOC131670298 [Phymastichus coffea]XP_058801786.1 uncharacterized protein LOC131670298 [Phymastichus coffea]XP_058801794.1 uncharacterized protein LOC131670298 [Phymastichus coffea]
MDYDSGMSDVGEQSAHAAVRFYVDNANVKFVPVKHIQYYNPGQKNVPYDAYVLNGKNAKGKTIYEPAAILRIADDKDTLEAIQKRWPKPNKRLSVVVRELAQKQQDTKSTKLTNVKEKGKGKKGLSEELSNKTRNVPPSVSDALSYMNDKVNILHNKSDFDEDDKKTNLAKTPSTSNTNKNKKASTFQNAETPPSTHSDENLKTPSSVQYSKKHPIQPCNIFLNNIMDGSSSEVNYRNIRRPIRQLQHLSPDISKMKHCISTYSCGKRILHTQITPSTSRVSTDHEHVTPIASTSRVEKERTNFESKSERKKEINQRSR